MTRGLSTSNRAMLEVYKDANQVLTTKTELLEQENQILKKNFDKIRDSLLIAAGLSLGRMIIEAGLAVNELRESMPSDPEPNEADLEEGELHDPAVGIWKKRLDKMITRISQAHTRSKEETQEIADTMTGMVEELQRLADGHPSIRRSKRLRDREEVDYQGADGDDDEDETEYNIESKRRRYEERRQGFKPEQFYPILTIVQPDKVPSQPFQSDGNNPNSVPTARMEDFPVSLDQQHQNPDASRLLRDAPERRPLQDIDPNANIATMGIHADRQKLMEGIKVEQDAEDPASTSHVAPAHHTAPVGRVAPIRVHKKWRIPYLNVNANQEESEWLEAVKSSWGKGGWTDRSEWVRAVLMEYRRMKTTARFEGEVESNLRILSYRIKTGDFLASMFGA